MIGATPAYGTCLTATPLTALRCRECPRHEAFLQGSIYWNSVGLCHEDPTRDTLWSVKPCVYRASGAAVVAGRARVRWETEVGDSLGRLDPGERLMVA
jgi:hypothetical protein